MNISNHSKERLINTFKNYQVDEEYYSPIYNYLVYGLYPGSFWTSVLANNFVDAIRNSHMCNQIPNLKTMERWIYFRMPDEAWGNYDAVDIWMITPANERRIILENKALIYTPEQETWLRLKEENHERFN